MGALQCAHLPRSARRPMTGTLWIGLFVLPDFGDTRTRVNTRSTGLPPHPGDTRGYINGSSQRAGSSRPSWRELGIFRSTAFRALNSPAISTTYTTIHMKSFDFVMSSALLVRP